MTTLAITGHRGLPADTEELVEVELRTIIAGHVRSGPLTGISCLADGADSLFAQAILDHGGSLTVIVPASQYRAGLPAKHHPTYDVLLAHASTVIQLDHTESSAASHMNASIRMIEDTDELLAVWDGQPARGYGGTADVVEAARQRGLSATVIWPDGATRG